MFGDEYRNCHDQENDWVDTLPYTCHLLNSDQTVDLIKFVCSVFECKPPNKVQFNVPLPPTVTGQYHSDNKVICIASHSYADITLVAHELAHHIHHELYGFSYFVSGFIRGHHSRRFLDIERRIFRVIEKWVKR